MARTLNRPLTFFPNASFFLMSNAPEIYISKFTLANLKKPLLFGNPSFNSKISKLALNGTTESTLSIKRFEEPLFQIRYTVIKCRIIYVLLVFNQTFLTGAPFTHQALLKRKMLNVNKEGNSYSHVPLIYSTRGLLNIPTIGEYWVQKNKCAK